MIITDVKMPYFYSIKTLPRLFNALNLCIQRDKSIEEITGIIERDPAIISAAGIVHDIGKIIMLQIFGDKYYNETVKVGLEDDQLMDVEKSMFGIDHSTLGGYFLNWWAFPLDIIEMTLYHHTPKDPDISNKKLVALMCIASKLEMRSFQSDSINYMDARDILNIDDSFLMDIHIKYNEAGQS